MAELLPNETLAAGPPGSPQQPRPLAALSEEGWNYIRREGEVIEELYHLRRIRGSSTMSPTRPALVPGSSGCAASCRG